MKLSTRILFAISGILMTVCAVLAFRNPVTTLVAISKVSGILSMVSGIACVVVYFKYLKGEEGSAFVLINGILDFILGAVFLTNSFFAISFIATLFAIMILVMGVNFTIFAFNIKKVESSMWIPMLIFGILGIFTGISLFANPFKSFLSISILIGIAFMARAIQYFSLVFKK